MAAQACVCVFCEFVSKFESKFALIENFCVFCELCVRLKAIIPEVVIVIVNVNVTAQLFIRVGALTNDVVIVRHKKP